jgi:hypothetical protein
MGDCKTIPEWFVINTVSYDVIKNVIIIFVEDTIVGVTTFFFLFVF